VISRISGWTELPEISMTLVFFTPYRKLPVLSGFERTGFDVHRPAYGSLVRIPPFVTAGDPKACVRNASPVMLTLSNRKFSVSPKTEKPCRELSVVYQRTESPARIET
jgi:hypothetical protein